MDWFSGREQETAAALQTESWCEGGTTEPDTPDPSPKRGDSPSHALRPHRQTALPMTDRPERSTGNGERKSASRRGCGGSSRPSRSPTSRTVSHPLHRRKRWNPNPSRWEQATGPDTPAWKPPSPAAASSSGRTPVNRPTRLPGTNRCPLAS